MADPKLVVVAGVAVRDGRIMLCQRLENSMEGAKWEFPGGKVERGELPEAALTREWREEMAVSARAGVLLDAVLHPCSPYPDRDLLILYYAVEALEGEPRPLECAAIAWAKPEEVEAYPLAPADRLFAERMRGRWGAVVSAEKSDG